MIDSNKPCSSDPVNWQKDPAVWSSHRDLTLSDSASSATSCRGYPGPLHQSPTTLHPAVAAKAFAQKTQNLREGILSNHLHKRELTIRDSFVAHSGREQGKRAAGIYPTYSPVTPHRGALLTRCLDPADSPFLLAESSVASASCYYWCRSSTCDPGYHCQRPTVKRNLRTYTLSAPAI